MVNRFTVEEIASSDITIPPSIVQAWHSYTGFYPIDDARLVLRKRKEAMKFEKVCWTFAIIGALMMVFSLFGAVEKSLEYLLTWIFISGVLLLGSTLILSSLVQPRSEGLLRAPANRVTEFSSALARVTYWLLEGDKERLSQLKSGELEAKAHEHLSFCAGYITTKLRELPKLPPKKWTESTSDVLEKMESFEEKYKTFMLFRLTKLDLATYFSKYT